MASVYQVLAITLLPNGVSVVKLGYFAMLGKKKQMK
jgi:hypothetical protein